MHSGTDERRTERIWARGVELLLLAVLVAAGWSIPGCETGCDPTTEDCSFSTTCCTPTTTASPAPLTLTCSNDGRAGELEASVLAEVAGGTTPYTYVVSWGQGPDTRGSGGNASAARFRIDHTYPPPETLEPRNYAIRVTVTDAANQTQTCSLEHRAEFPRLHMDCEASAREGEAPLSVRFQARPYDCFGTCRVIWTLGDGETFEGTSVDHTYEYPAPPPFFTFAAGATLRDSADRRSYCNLPIQVLAPPPPPNSPTTPMNQPPVIANFTATPSTILPGGAPAQLTATLSDADGDPLSWTLSLDPGAAPGTLTVVSGTGNVSSAYAATGPGQTRVRLLVNDGRGGSAQATVMINVRVSEGQSEGR